MRERLLSEKTTLPPSVCPSSCSESVLGLRLMLSGMLWYSTEVKHRWDLHAHLSFYFGIVFSIRLDTAASQCILLTRETCSFDAEPSSCSLSESIVGSSSVSINRTITEHLHFKVSRARIHETRAEKLFLLQRENPNIKTEEKSGFITNRSVIRWIGTGFGFRASSSLCLCLVAGEKMNE